tara:strand:+ start:651 stop:1673 length:1023 start_codon:yes stop_codon:yes gene_type:complete
MDKIKVLVVGASGYMGVQLIKLLIKHKGTKIVYLCGNNSIGKDINYFDNKIKKKTLPKIIKFNKKLTKNIDVIFTATPNGDAHKISKYLNNDQYLIDLSADFRLNSPRNYLKWYKKPHGAKNKIKKSIYALPEIVSKKVKSYNIISCPGCYPTSVLLALIPLIKNKLIKSNNIIIDSKSGYSGAGRTVHKKYKNKNLYESLSVYGIKNHRHNPEIQQELNQISKKKVEFNFTPHLSPMFRGIISTIYVDLEKTSSLNKVTECLKKEYNTHEFIKIMKKNVLLSTNNVINTNNCEISICSSKNKNKIIILVAIDNLIKGGTGQAIQNFNNLFNFKSNEGLK